jgi:hypothetical protein
LYVDIAKDSPKTVAIEMNQNLYFGYSSGLSINNTQINVYRF